MPFCPHMFSNWWSQRVAALQVRWHFAASFMLAAWTRALDKDHLPQREQEHQEVLNSRWGACGGCWSDNAPSPLAAFCSGSLRLSHAVKVCAAIFLGSRLRFLACGNGTLAVVRPCAMKNCPTCFSSPLWRGSDEWIPDGSVPADTTMYNLLCQGVPGWCEATAHCLVGVDPVLGLAKCHVLPCTPSGVHPFHPDGLSCR